MTERVEGWSCTVYEASGQLVAVNTGKSHLKLPGENPTWKDYIRAKYEVGRLLEVGLRKE